MKKIFCLFVVVLLMIPSLSAQTTKRNTNSVGKKVTEAELVRVQDNSADTPVKYFPVVRHGNTIEAPLSGPYTIGVGGSYTKLSDAVNALVSQGVSGPVTFSFTDANYTDTSLVISAFAGQGSTNPVIFQLAGGNPSAKIFFTGGITTRTWGIRFDSTQYVSFIGSTTVGTRPITFEVDTTVGNPTRNVFQVIRSNNIRLEGLELIGHRRYSDASAGSILFQTFFTGSTDNNNDIVYTNLLLKRGSTCFNIGGISTVIRDNNITVSNCDFGSSNYIETFSSRGFSLSFTDNLTIYKNDIRRGKNFPAATSAPAGIIAFGGMNNFIISHNMIHDLEKYGTTAGGTTGIRFQTNGPGVYTNAKIYNNMIYDLRNPSGLPSAATQAVEGIALSSTSPNPFNVVEVNNNTIHLTGNLSASASAYSAALITSSTQTADTVKFYNNIVSNEMLSSPTLGYGDYPHGDFIHASGSGGVANRRLKADRNLYWYAYGDGDHFLSLYSGDTLAAWQTNTLEDASSIDRSDPFFISSTNPHININALSPVDGSASPVAYITDDIDLQARSLTTPDIGADEYTYVAPSVLNPASFSAAAVSISQIDLTFTPNGSSNNVVIVWNLTGSFSTPSGTPPSVGSAFAGGTLLYNGLTSPRNHTPLSSGVQYFYKAFSYDGVGNYSIGVTDNATTLMHDIGAYYIDDGSFLEKMISNAETNREFSVSSELKNIIKRNLSLSFSGIENLGSAKSSGIFKTITANYGDFTENTYQLGWKVDGVAQTNVNNSDSLTVGDTDTLTHTWGSPTTGFHTAQSWTIMAGDIDAADDSSYLVTFEVPTANTVFREGFDGAVFPPTGWLTVNADGGSFTPWFWGSPANPVAPLEMYGYAGNNYQRANGYHIDDWLITPNTGGLKGTDATQDSLVFWVKSVSSIYADSIEIRVSTTDTARASFTTLLAYINVPKTGWTRFAYALPNAATRYIAFRYLHFDGGALGNSSDFFGLDLVEIQRHTSKTLNLTALIEGFYDGSTMVPDTVTVELRSSSSPYTLVDQAKVVLNSSGAAAVNFYAAANSVPYYIAVKHRNSLQTWSNTTPSFSGGVMAYNFTTAQTQAYGSNMKNVGGEWCIYNGDVNGDEFIDGSDVSDCFNDANLGASGYIVTDLTGDDFVDGTDVSIAFNNSNLGVGAFYPSK